MQKQTIFQTEEQRWQAVVRNSVEADDAFVYAVKTTGVFCLPSCKSRRPNRVNVEFFEKPAEAIAAGYRECKRCCPVTRKGANKTQDKIIEACQIIKANDFEIKLDDLAARVGLSSYHFHRLFKKILGVTPKQFFKMEQMKRLQKNVVDEGSVTDAVYSSGFGSSSGFYEEARKQLGMKPSRYRKGGEGLKISYGFIECSVGLIVVGATAKGVCCVEIGNDEELLLEQLKGRFSKAIFRKAGNDFEELFKEVIDVVNKPLEARSIPLDIQGTAFQKRVWQVLLQIKPGTTMTYSEVAAKIGSPKAVRAVATACASNKIALIIPCHRVIGKNGKLSGYRWGVERKKQLLEDEARQKK